MRITKNKKAVNFSMVRGILFAVIVGLVLLLLVKAMVPRLFTTRLQQCKVSLMAAKTLTTPVTGKTIVSISCPPRYVFLSDGRFIVNGDKTETFWVKGKEYSRIPNSTSNDFIEEAIKNALANEMYSCWDIGNRGDIAGAFNPKFLNDQPYALICSKFRVDDSYKSYASFTITDFINYLKNHKIPNHSETYFKYLSNKLVKNIKLLRFNINSKQYTGLSILPDSDEEKKIDLTSEHTITLLIVKPDSFTQNGFSLGGSGPVVFNFLVPTKILGGSYEINFYENKNNENEDQNKGKKILLSIETQDIIFVN